MVEYFRDLLGQPPSHSASQDNPADIGAATPPAADGSELNEAFTAASVVQGIKSLRGGKATVGSLKLNALSVAVASLAPCLAQVFDACKRVGALPRSWALCGITPIHKGGDTNDPGNYRGIAVGSLLAKLYASMLNEMLMGWTERWNQWGGFFRRAYRSSNGFSVGFSVRGLQPLTEKMTPRSGVRFSRRSNFRFRGWSVGNSHFVTAQLSIASAITHPSLSLVVSK